ncbi:MAG: PAS-domain containing protein [Phyllobacteriaceae bacterium]|nr:PAS-domain containing protein [Phyllobacteriaceae bacterium]
MPTRIPLGDGRGRFMAMATGALARRLWRASTALVFAVPATPALAAETAAGLGALEVLQLAIFAGAMGAALLSAIWLIRERQRTSAENLELRGKVADLQAEKQVAEAMLGLKDQRIVAWPRDGGRPEMTGSLAAVAGVPDQRGPFLAFGRWLAPSSAASLDRAVEALRANHAAFDLVVETLSGAVLETEGRNASGRVFVRFRAADSRGNGDARLRLDYQRLFESHETLSNLVAVLPFPFWLRGADNRLALVNAAYAQAVDAADAKVAVAENREFLGTQAREALALHHQKSPVFAQTLSAVVGGDRRIFAVSEFAGPGGSAGLAVDVSEAETLRGEIRRVQKNHAETLDQLTTAVAIFDAGEKLRFYNQAFQKLWGLDPSFLDGAPDNTVFLDRLRTRGLLAEQPEWRRWKDNLLSAYRSLQPQEHWWHLPDGRTIRVVANPLPQGGVTWVFENLTEHIDLETRYNAAIRVQSETIDNLVEGVAVFGSDGKLRLWNPAFIRLWSLAGHDLATSMHVAELRRICAHQVVDNPWDEFVAIVTGFDEERRDRHGRVELRNGAILSWGLVPLPNGQAMTTFVDVTDSANVERALQDRNEALERADRLKSDFVQHVSYELRTPLTNIIGFTQLLAMAETGALSSRQSEYVEHISLSSAQLMTIVNDILDLATIDAGAMELDISESPVATLVAEAIELIGERMREHAITVVADLSAAPQNLRADAGRVRQILFNLLSNAANFAPEGSTVKIECRAEAEAVVFKVHDDGPGMPEDVIGRVFDRFSQNPGGSRRRGAGLGLSVVKAFVELHGGHVELETGKDRGTTVTCRFPLQGPTGLREAAE